MNGPEAAGSAQPGAQGSEGKGSDGREKKESNPFAEYMWMENEEDFDRQVSLTRPITELWDGWVGLGWKGPCILSPCALIKHPSHSFPVGPLRVLEGHHKISKSTLNPDAKEFVPGVKY
uniref:Ataxin-2 C-terminal domain-containing protein n=1 Tax=Pavo cristatus TaxID=9049 RepID=A0A8C9LE65_PAVCR